MQTIDNIIQFHSIDSENSYNDEINASKETESMIAYPTEQEIHVMNALAQQYSDQNPNEMIPFELWNGGCYQALFEEMSSYAKEIGVDPWDAFALFIKKIHGLKIEEDEDGGVTVKQKQ